jgi:hypothetical protein
MSRQPSENQNNKGLFTNFYNQGAFSEWMFQQTLGGGGGGGQLVGDSGTPDFISGSSSFLGAAFQPGPLRSLLSNAPPGTTTSNNLLAHADSTMMPTRLGKRTTREDEPLDLY